MDKSKITYELIVVNDGSTDGTRELVEKYISDSKPKKLSLWNHSPNRGYGASLKTGIRNARYPNICITDADQTYPNEEIPAMFNRYLDNSLDMIVGQRDFKKLPTLTKPAKWVLNKLANFLLGYKIPDINSGLRIFKRDIALRYFPIICDGFSFTTTITLAMISNHFIVEYYKIEYFEREGKSKIKPARDTLNFIQLIIRTILYFNPLKIFIPISLFIFLISIGLYIMGKCHILFNEMPVDSITILFLAGVQIFATGLLADMIDKRLGM
jgi:glycosyltransferase involved in cell wall biosynthesis